MHSNTQTRSIINTWYVRKHKAPSPFSLVSNLLPFSSLRKYKIWRLIPLVTSFKVLIKQYLCLKHKETAWKFQGNSHFRWLLFYSAKHKFCQPYTNYFRFLLVSLHTAFLCQNANSHILCGHQRYQSNPEQVKY